ncbi:MAG: MBL fold metallo-hydrolase [Acidobacteria bacterium]|nr:MBL fold metallo-hydrolase [Acidobacteriota bacterium]
MNNNSKKLVGIALVILAALLAILFVRKFTKPVEEFIPGPTSGKLVIRFLDIGQGDSELIQLPEGGWILIDSGDRGKPTSALLKKYGVNELALIIATHPHADHIGEMRDVMRAFQVKEFWDAGFTNSATKTYTDMLAEIKQHGIKLATPKQGETRQFGDVKIEVLHPSTNFVDDNPNNASVVVRLTYGSKRFLFTGDTEVAAWKEMLAAEPEKLRADLLKAAHHGSSNGTTKEVLEAVQPAIYTISCAVGNDYHHPHSKVVDLLRKNSNLRVYRTDLEGTITAVCDGNSIEMSSEREAARNQLYATGDEVAGNASNHTGGDGGMGSGRRGGKGKR